MTDQFVVAPMLVALVTIVATLGTRRRLGAQIALSVAGALAYAGTVLVIVRRVVFSATASPATYQLGGWPAPFGITLVADALSAFMLSMVAIVGPAALVFSVSYMNPDEQRVFYHPLFHCLLLGVSGAFLTGDLFNLFVWFEVMLLSSYVFVAFYGKKKHTRAAFWYVVLNLIGSVVMLVAIGGLYAVTGTLNMADMARRLAAPATFGIEVGAVVGLSALLFVVFALKAGLVPFQFWVPAAYRAAPLPVTALLAGVTKKVGLYAVVRLYFTVFGGTELTVSIPGTDGNTVLAFYGIVLLCLATASVLVGGLGALDAASLEGVFAYSSISQIGFIVIPLAIGAASSVPAIQHLGVLAALVYALNHALAKSTLFMAAGTVRSAIGTSRLDDLGGIAARSPALAGVVFVAALSLVGIPPLTGFFGKLLVFDVALRAEAAFGLALLLGGTGLTIAYTTRMWNRAFWGTETPAVSASSPARLQIAVVVALSACILVVGLGFDPVYRFADAAASAATDRGAYIEAVGLSGGEGA
ncbi:Na+/H+ antiporter subunit D [Halalkalicoccus jeotgali]|uniref:NADH/Ubiquinone/plastoquinone (Complex I) n=1 Tax=Halalkalicoccus jeotgali (strain DSM 18796 / CECT 7217 / JCM 14584 / KCTC 4019 / B3) TaxID=795797 RepID=D8J8T7_HALJB|nr:Na+/H+ antiporter subunit D [Halalkalicoccus jeotgali]ADJ14272.1 NADH/Ubiquinone/plastoquinone (complex I) [Halalkalicoccus jeotgali B3]ELY40534.1 NADH/Ubiquinone/plastoquinone (complex I) [Halalkalicoccus jeotgali B3]